MAMGFWKRTRLTPETTGLTSGTARLIGSKLTPKIKPPVSAGVAVGAGAAASDWYVVAGTNWVATTLALKISLGLGATYGSWEGCQ